ncbi:MAG: BON domain-containing protein [Candidatus Competibacteraceae bacterium]|nr:BON domain-containing protein [Candidatus Competibacteraceae bacterium]
MKPSKSQIAICLACGLFTGTAFSSDLVASIQQGTTPSDTYRSSMDRIAPPDATHIPVSEEMLIESAGVAPEDAEITLQVLRILSTYGAPDVAVVTREGLVTLVGFVPGTHNLQQIVDSVEAIAGVKVIKTEALSVG